MNQRKTLVGFGLLVLVVAATILGCGTTPGTLFMDITGSGTGSSIMPRFAYVANSDPECGGDCNPLDISAYTVNAATGALTAVAGSPFSTQAFSGVDFFMDMDPAGHFLFVTGRGQDLVQVFSIDQTTGVLKEVGGSPFKTGGTDAYDVEVDSAGKFVYVSNTGVGIDSAPGSGSITVFAIASTGALSMVGAPVPTKGFAHHLAISPNGKFLYTAEQSVSLAGYMIEGYAVDSSTGGLTAIPGSPFPAGNCPEALEADYVSQFLIVPNRCDGTVSVFKIDQTTGVLSAASGSPFSAGLGPVNFAEAQIGGKTYIGVSNVGSKNISVYTLDMTTGVLTPVNGSPFSLANNAPSWISAGGAFAYISSQVNGNLRIASVDSTGKPTETTGSPVITGGLTIPNQIRLVY